MAFKIERELKHLIIYIKPFHIHCKVFVRSYRRVLGDNCAKYFRVKTLGG
jgi:hypothetical protein